MAVSEPHIRTWPPAAPAERTLPLRLLTFTTLYPNAVQPNHGVFVENRLRHLVATGRVESRVVAPVGWFPLRSGPFARYAGAALIPASERRFDIPILHPRFPILPKIGMTLAPWLLFAAMLPVLRRIQRDYPFDAIDAHYFYPDGVAAILLGKALGKPVAVTARGTDLNLIPRYLLPRAMIRGTAQHADGLITVSQALKEALVALGIEENRVRVLRNGVDLTMFRPADRVAARARLGLTGPTLLSVGLLIPRKGHDLVIAALTKLPECTLLIAGEGPERSALERQAASLGLGNRVRFLGSVPHDALPEIYSAADALVLASSREGWANVLLEAMACGTPVVATNLWGNPEVVAQPEAGRLMRERTDAALVVAVRDLFDALPDRQSTRRYAEDFSWEVTTTGQIELFEEMIARTRASMKQRAG